MDLKKNLTDAFDKAACSYEQAAKIQFEIGSRLLERLDFIKLRPIRILDLGCGTGRLSQLLKKRYPHAEVIALDLSLNMVRQVQKRQQWQWRGAPLLIHQSCCQISQPGWLSV